MKKFISPLILHSVLSERTIEINELLRRINVGAWLANDDDDDAIKTW
jgi:hypothetical protein